MTRSDRRSLAMEFDIGAPRLSMHTFGWGGRECVREIEWGKQGTTYNKDWPHRMVKWTGHIGHRLASRWWPCWQKRCPFGVKE